MGHRSDFQDILDQCYSQFEEIYMENQQALVQVGYEKAKGANSWNREINGPHRKPSQSFIKNSYSTIHLKLSALMITAIWTCYLHYINSQSNDPIVEFFRWMNIFRITLAEGIERR